MRAIDPKEIFIALIAFVLLSFIFKLIFLSVGANLVAAFFPEDSMAPVYVGLALAVVVTGLAIGALLNSRNGTSAVSHGLVVGSLAGIYKALRPELTPLPPLMVAVFSLLNFGAIIWGVHVTGRSRP
ncbi:MAG: hypothetical protein AAF680_12630 [Pseudomonadota bacterium]